MNTVKDIDTSKGSAAVLLAEFRNYGGSGGTFCDAEISEAIDVIYAHGLGANADSIPFIRDSEFFDAVTVIDAHNYPTLAIEGIIHPDDVVNFLFDCGLDDFYRNNEKSVSVAKRLNISPVEYTEIYGTYKDSRASDEEMIQALELQAKLRTHKLQVPNVVHQILQGSVRYKDAESIGFDRCSARARSATTLVYVLSDLKRNKGRYNLEDIRAIYERSSPDAEPHGDTSEETWVDRSISARLDIMQDTDGDTALKLKHPLYISEMRMTESKVFSAKGNDIASLMLYVDQLFAAANCTRKLIPTSRDIVMFHDEGVDPALVIKETMNGATIQRILAIHGGAAPALVDGWL